MFENATNRLTLLIWLLYLGSVVFAPTHAVVMLKMAGSAAAGADPAACPMHAPHDASSGDADCVCAGSCSLTGNDRPAPAPAGPKLNIQSASAAPSAADVTTGHCTGNQAAYASRAPPDSSLG